MTRIYSKIAFAELLGMHTGDSTIYRNKKYLVFELRGNIDEKEMYDKKVVSLFYSSFHIRIKTNYRSGGKSECYGVRTCNQEIINKFVNACFPIGSKSSNVKIPKLIESGKPKEKIAILRGLFATDGTAYLARINNTQHNNYLIIEFATISKTLRDQTQKMLEPFGLNSRIWTYHSKKYNKTYYLRLSGIRKCQTFIKIIGFSNAKHRDKLIAIFKKDVPVS